MAPEPIRVAVDATPLLGNRTGVGNFTAALLDGLARRDDVAVSAFPLSARGHRRLRDEVPDGVEVRSIPLPARALRAAWLRGDHPRLDPLLARPDVVHGPNFVVPPSRRARVVTVHDLTCVRYPELCEADTLQYPALIRRAIRSGAWIHTVTDAVRAEVLDTFDADPDRVVTVHNGVDPVYGDPGRGRRLAGVDAYVLAVGTIEPRKDLPGLLAAVDDLVTTEDDVTLVHVGADGWGTQAFEAALGRLEHPDRVVRLGPRHGAELHDLYAGARVVAYPSVYEGFGLVALEAMSAGVPVVTTDVPALREVVDGAALTVAPGDHDALVDALATAWTDEERRAQVVAAGADRVGDFGWDRCVEGMVGLYRRAVGAF